MILKKCFSLNSNYIDSVLEVTGRYYIKKNYVNQLCLILIIVTVGLKFYQCSNEL